MMTTQYSQITEWLKLEGASEGDLVQPPASFPGHIQMAFEYLQGCRLYNLSGQPVLVLSHSHSKNVFPHEQRKLPYAFYPVKTL